ncbi:M28 family metallopeptidase [Clostridium arbusti]|uniref:M28 family metallopeptidase n=1 Tax=Clostridium arbusti TaxID=1137848 RepID=UPI000288CB4B|nr:M28 family metallopeptidase [Clostridium arbusti]
MKKKIASIFLIVFILISIFSFHEITSIHKFDSNAVKENINYLSSDTFKGRLAGTFENEQASAYIKSEFKKNGIKPLNKDYYENFKVIYPEKISGAPYLRVINKQGQTIKVFNYGTDFKEDMISFKQNRTSFSKGSSVTVKDTFIRVSSGKGNYVFYTPDDNNLDFRSSFDSSSKFSLLIMVKKDTLKAMENYLNDNNTIDCFIPYKETETSVNNVVGYIKGKNSSLPPIVISGHFDHLGEDLLNTTYPGALDNASGISFVMEMSKYIKSLGTPDRDIIFAAFNGEEYGLRGSEVFANEYLTRLEGGKVFNFDMIGSDNSVPLGIMGAKDDSDKTPLIYVISKICTDNNIHYNNLFEDNSDHSPFRKLGIDAITFCDNDTKRIHTPNDKAEFISTASIDRAYNVSSKEILHLSFGRNPIVMYSRYVATLSLTCTVICTFYLIVIYKKDV